MATSEADVAAKLIERLLMDPAFRARFRRNPAEACREAGLEELAQEMQLGAGKAMMTLDLRESKSSLAGVMMAAAMEGVGVMQFAQHVAPHLDDIPEAIGDVLSRVNLPAIGGSLAPPPKVTAPPPPDAAEGADAGADPEAANGATPAAAAAPAAAPPAAAATPEAAAAAKGGDAAEPEAAAAKPKTAAEAAAEKIAKEESPEAKTAEEAKKAVEDIADDAKDVPSGTDLPDDTDEPQASIDVGEPRAAAPAPAAAPAAPAAPVIPEQAAAAPPAAVEAPAPAPDAHDHDGEEPAGRAAGVPPPESSSSVQAAASALLENKNLVLDADAQKDIRSGDVDPRMIALLGKLTEKHKIELSVIKTGHAKFSAGGGVSNHFVGRGIDIATVDGEIVRPNSAAARELATEIAELSGNIRPTEIGTPWAIDEPGYFTDSGHLDHLHVGFDDVSLLTAADAASELGTSLVPVAKRNAAPAAEPRFEAAREPATKAKDRLEPRFEVSR